MRLKFDPKLGRARHQRRGAAKQVDVMIGGGVLAVLCVAAWAFLKSQAADQSAQPDAAPAPAIAELGVLGSTEHPPACVAVSPDGKLAASGDNGYTIVLWEIASGKKRAQLTGHRAAVTALAFSADSRRLASGSTDRTVRLWDLDSLQEPAVLDGHRDGITCLAYDVLGAYLLSGSEEGVARLWDAQSGKELHRYAGHSGDVTAVAFSPEGRQIASADTAGSVRLWEVVEEAKPVRVMKGGPGSGLAIAFSPDTSTLSAAFGDGSVRIWDLRGGPSEPDVVESESSHTWSRAAFSVAATRVAAACSDDALRLLDLPEGAASASDAHSAEFRGLALTPDARFVISAGTDQKILVWSLPFPSLAELEGTKKLVDLVKQRSEALADYAGSMRKGAAAAEAEKLGDASTAFEQAASQAPAGSLEREQAESAREKIRQGQQRVDAYVLHLQNGKKALEQGETEVARKEFQAARDLAPERPEAKEGLAKVDEVAGTKKTLKAAKTKADLRFDFESGGRDLLELGHDFAYVYDEAEVARLSRSAPFGLLRQPLPPPLLGLTSSPLKWTVEMNTPQGIENDGLQIRLELSDISTGQRLASQDYPLRRGDRSHVFVGRAAAPEGGWSTGEYAFRQYLVTGERASEAGDHKKFSIGLLKWTGRVIGLAPQDVQQSDSYRLKTGVTAAAGDAVRLAASGEIAPVSSAVFFKDWLGDDVKTSIGPSGLRRTNPRRPEFYYDQVDNRQPFAALLYRLEGETDWTCYQKPWRDLSTRSGEWQLSINSIVGRKRLPAESFSEISKTTKTYWLPDCGTFQVKLHCGKFFFRTSLNDQAKRYLLEPFVTTAA